VKGFAVLAIERFFGNRPAYRFMAHPVYLSREKQKSPLAFA
jgi:hypothetical protein